MEKILSYPKIYQNDKLIGHGGNQDWFNDKWAKRAGCGSVSATDIWMYYMAKQVEFQKVDYLMAMEKMFNIMTPAKYGFPYAYMYARRMRKLFLEHDMKMDAKILRNPTHQEGCEQIKKAIDNDNPIGLLILKHRHPRLLNDLWHWVTIFGYVETKQGIDVVFVDCGKRKQIPAKILFQNNTFNWLKMVTFYKQ